MLSGLIQSVYTSRIFFTKMKNVAENNVKKSEPKLLKFQAMYIDAVDYCYQFLN